MSNTLALYSYAFAVGGGVALADLSNLENHLGAQNRKTASGKLYRVGIRAPLLNPYPIRQLAGSGKELGGGMVFVTWNLMLCKYGLRYWLNTYFGYSSTPLMSVAMTINTRRHELDSYTRGNCYAILPTFGEDGDVQYLGQGVFRLRQRFNDFVSL